MFLVLPQEQKQDGRHPLKVVSVWFPPDKSNMMTGPVLHPLVFRNEGNMVVKLLWIMFATSQPKITKMVIQQKPRKLDWPSRDCTAPCRAQFCVGTFAAASTVLLLLSYHSTLLLSARIAWTRLGWGHPCCQSVPPGAVISALPSITFSLLSFSASKVHICALVTMGEG